jgi:hypothetical protein
MDRTYRPTLVALFIATLVGFAFSFIAGFSIGRFTVLVPLITTGYAVSYALAFLRPPRASSTPLPPNSRR